MRRDKVARTAGAQGIDLDISKLSYPYTSLLCDKPGSKQVPSHQNSPHATHTLKSVASCQEPGTGIHERINGRDYATNIQELRKFRKELAVRTNRQASRRDMSGPWLGRASNRLVCPGPT